MYELFFYCMAVITVILQMVCQWYFGKGQLKAAYPLTILTVLCYIAMDIGMVMYDTALGAVLIFSIANIWTLAMCARGIMRLRAEEKDKKNND